MSGRGGSGWEAGVDQHARLRRRRVQVHVLLRAAVHAHGRDAQVVAPVAVQLKLRPAERDLQRGVGLVAVAGRAVV